MADTPDILDDLKTRSARELLLDAKIELTVAIKQSAPSDDRIILDHVRKALTLLETIR